MRRRVTTDFEGFGADSFLDIVANLVGILVILVMVLGVRIRDAQVAARAAPTGPDQIAAAAPTVESPPAPDLSAAVDATEQVTSQIHEMTREMVALDHEARTRFQERGQLQLLITAAERALAERRAELNADQQRQVQLARSVDEVRGQLQQALHEIEAAEAYRPPTEVLAHLPTPLARTVFGQEAHFRLLDGRLTYVPINELTDKLKAEAPQKIWKLKDVPQITETIGPVDGFYLRYTLRRAEHSSETRLGPVVRHVIELARFTVDPVDQQIGEPLGDALREGSDFRRRLAAFHPDDTTLTIWTYPDSFEAFRTLKLRLHEIGFVTAARPLPAGQPISGSPQGSRSAAQ